MCAADAAWPGCGRSACRSAASTRSVPSRPSTLIAAARSAVSSSSRRSCSARTSMPSMPSVPLMRARPSFSASSTGASPWSRERLGRRAHRRPSSSTTSPSPMTASAQCASGARSPEQPRLPYSRTTGREPGVEHGRVRLGGLEPDAGVAGGQGRQPQQHQRADDLVLDPRPGAGGVRPDQAALQLRALVGRDVAGGECAEAGRDAVDRDVGRGELVDAHPRPLDRGARASGRARPARLSRATRDDVVGATRRRPDR